MLLIGPIEGLNGSGSGAKEPLEASLRGLVNIVATILRDFDGP